MTKIIYIVYYSRNGNTRNIAEHILEAFNKIEHEDINIELMDATNLNYDALKSAVGYIIGTPNYFSAPSGYIKVFFDELFKDRAILKGRPVFYFVSHGGSGDIKHIGVMCDWLELKTIGPPIIVKGNNISSNHIKTIGSNLLEMMKLVN